MNAQRVRLILLWLCIKCTHTIFPFTIPLEDDPLAIPALLLAPDPQRAIYQDVDPLSIAGYQDRQTARQRAGTTIRPLEFRQVIPLPRVFA